MLGLVSLRHGKIRLHPTPLGQRRDPPAGAPRRASPLGCHHGRASLSGVPAICGTRAALCCRIPEALAGPDRLAIGRLQVPSARPLDRLAPARAVPPLAADCQQHPPAGVGPSRARSPTLATCVMAANLRRLSADWQDDLRPSAGVGRGLRRPEAVRRHPVCGRELEVGRAHPRVLAQQRSLHRAPRPAQEDVRLSPPARGPKTAALAPAMPFLGAGAPRAGASGRGRGAVVAARVRIDPGSPPRSGPQVQAADPAGDLGTGASVRLPRRRRHLAVCLRSEPGGVAHPRRLAPQDGRVVTIPPPEPPCIGP